MIMNLKWIVVLLKLSLSVGQVPLLDSRCYLEGGGSAENFIVSEDIAVGSVVGQLKINGDPSSTITLSLRERDRGAPVKIEKGTKDLVLISPLDKEGVRGPSSVYVNVVCDRRHSTDPSFVIPVNIRVTDQNDNNPKWIGAPYVISLSEVTVPGTRILQGARALDLDQPGPFSTVEYQVLPGPYSDYVDFVNTLEGTLQLKKTLDYETLKNFTIKLRAQDQGTPPKFSDTSLRVIVLDADDQNPKFQYESYRGELPANGKTGRLKIRPKVIRALDQDEGLQADIFYSIAPDSSLSRFFSINPKTADIDLITPFEKNDGNSITLVIRAIQVDNKDRYALATLIIATESNNIQNNINSNNNNMVKLQFIQPKYEARVREDVPPFTRILALPTNKPSERYLQYTISDPVQKEFFEVGEFGEVLLRQSLDYEKITRHSFYVMASDGISNATCQVVVEVLNVNDWEPRFKQPYYRFVLPQMNEDDDFNTTIVPMALGKIEAADGDYGDKIFFNLKGKHSALFDVDSRGIIWLKEPLRSLKQSDISLIAVATDSGQRQTTVPITLTVEGGKKAASAFQLPSFMGLLVGIVFIFVFLVFLISIFVYKRKSKSSNRIHSNLPSSMQSSSNLVSPDKHTMASPAEPLNFCGSGSSLSVGASTILAASLEREAQLEHKATMGVLAAYRGRFYGHQSDDIEKDSITNSDTAREIVNDQRNKKLSWRNDEQKNDTSGSLDGSTENNLIVYF